MAIEEDPPMGIPEWVVTFGDMMSLLLTFFIMLVSMSKMKEEEKFQAMVESVRRKFGYDDSSASPIPGNNRPRNSRMAKLATQGRAKRLDIMRGGNKVQAPVGDHPTVRIVRPGNRTAVGTVIYFEEFATALSEANKKVLAEEMRLLQGKPQKIEVRGHTGLRPVSDDSSHSDNWDLAYARCRAATRYLVDELHIDPHRIRMSVAGKYEPVHIGSDSLKMKQNPRVEVFMLDEVVSDLLGTPSEQKLRLNDSS